MLQKERISTVYSNPEGNVLLTWDNQDKPTVSCMRHNSPPEEYLSNPLTL